MAALSDQVYLADVKAKVTTARDAIAAIARAHGLTPIPSATNFVTLDCRRDGPFATRVLTELGQRGVFIRKPGVAPLDRCIRVTCGPPEALAAFAAALPDALAAAEGA